MTNTEKVFIGMYDNRYGTDIKVSRNRETLEAWRKQIALDEFDEMFPDFDADSDFDEELDGPLTELHKVAYYWAEVEGESFTIVEEYIV
jgi:hypothetical protein